MGKFVMLIVLAAMLGGTYYAMNGQRTQYDTEGRQADDDFVFLARNAALLGVDRAEQLLADDFRDYSNIAGSYDGSAYQATAVTNPTDSTVVVRSTATVQTRKGTQVTFNIRADYKRLPWILTSPPPFMQYMLMAQGDISFSGNFTIGAYTPLDGSVAPPNTNVHTNSNLAVNNTNPIVEGFGTYTMSVLPDLATASGVFTPNDNPSASNTVYQTPSVTIPPLDPATMASAMTVDSTTSGSVTITSQADLAAVSGTRADPYVWHITGDLVFDADVSVSGYVIFLVDNHLDFNRNVTTLALSHEGKDENTVAYYAGALTKVNGNLEIWGQIFSNSAVIASNGSATYYGGIVTHASMDMGGGAAFYHREISPVLTKYWQGGDNDKLVRTAYSEW